MSWTDYEGKARMSIYIPPETTDVITYPCPDLSWSLSAKKGPWCKHYQIDGLVPDCSNSSALAMELPQSCTELWNDTD